MERAEGGRARGLEMGEGEMIFARYAYTSAVSRWPDGYARTHWMEDTAWVRAAVARMKERGEDVKYEAEETA